MRYINRLFTYLLTFTYSGGKVLQQWRDSGGNVRLSLHGYSISKFEYWRLTNEAGTSITYFGSRSI